MSGKRNGVCTFGDRRTIARKNSAQRFRGHDATRNVAQIARGCAGAVGDVPHACRSTSGSRRDGSPLPRSVPRAEAGRSGSSMGYGPAAVDEVFGTGPGSLTGLRSQSAPSAGRLARTGRVAGRTEGTSVRSPRGGVDAAMGADAVSQHVDVVFPSAYPARSPRPRSLSGWGPTVTLGPPPASKLATASTPWPPRTASFLPDGSA